MGTGEEDEGSGTHGWKVEVPHSVKQQLQAGHGYEIEFADSLQTGAQATEIGSRDAVVVV